MIKALRHKTEAFLYKRNFQSPAVRTLLGAQILLSLAAFAGGLILLPFTDWLIFFSSGAIISTFNFWHIARFASRNTSKHFSILMGLKYFLMFNIRLIATGILLFILIVCLRAPLLPLVAGLASITLVILAWSISNASTTQA